MDLKNVSTKELVDELENREGVEEILVKPYEGYLVKTEERSIASYGPTRILCVID